MSCMEIMASIMPCHAELVKLAKNIIETKGFLVLYACLKYRFISAKETDALSGTEKQGFSHGCGMRCNEMEALMETCRSDLSS